MNKKGFTLIELLAVIVILAIIALIATPIVMNVIENAGKGTAERSAENYIHAVELAVMEKKLNGSQVIKGTYGITAEGNLCAGGVTSCANPIAIDVNGNKPRGGTILIENGTVTISSSVVIGDYAVSYDAEKKTYVATKEENENTSTIVYRWSFDEINIGQTIDPTDTTKFTTDPTTLGINAYLKHTLDKDNKVTELYACARFNNKETCVRGGEDYYTENKLILEGLQDEGLSCTFSESDSYCKDGSLDLQANHIGYAHTGEGSSYCCIYSDGSSTCGC